MTVGISLRIALLPWLFTVQSQLFDLTSDHKRKKKRVDEVRRRFWGEFSFLFWNYAEPMFSGPRLYFYSAIMLNIKDLHENYFTKFWLWYSFHILLNTDLFRKFYYRIILNIYQILPICRYYPIHFTLYLISPKNL